jgi:hypothetical protein
VQVPKPEYGRDKMAVNQARVHVSMNHSMSINEMHDSIFT